VNFSRRFCSVGLVKVLLFIFGIERLLLIELKLLKLVVCYGNSYKST
jgi:hypothetical protein